MNAPANMSEQLPWSREEFEAKLRATYGQGTVDKKVNLIDGIRISYKDGWALARASNTQPVLVLRFESETEDGLNRIRREVESVVQPLL